MQKSIFLLVLSGFLFVASNLAQSQQLDQNVEADLVERLMSDDIHEKSDALVEIRELGIAPSPEIRAALITRLEDANNTIRLSRESGAALDTLDSPEFIAELQRTVAELNDPSTIPLLADSLGFSNLVPYLVDFGELAAPHVIDLAENTESDTYVINDGLRILKLMVENHAEKPLSTETMTRIQRATAQRLEGRQYFTTLWYAIDLAAVIGDPELRQTISRLSSSADNIRARGITEPRLIAKTQQRAAARLAGERARPRLEDFQRSNQALP